MNPSEVYLKQKKYINSVKEIKFVHANKITIFYNKQFLIYFKILSKLLAAGFHVQRTIFCTD